MPVIKFASLLVAGSLTALSCTYVSEPEESASESVKKSVAREPVAEMQQVSMTRLYNENCSKCHGERGEGGGGGTQTLLTREKFDQKHDRPYFDAIKKGVPDAGMEAYGETMTDEQIWGLVVHIRELQGRALRAEFGSPKATNGVYTAKTEKFKVETVVNEDAGLSIPWSLDWLPDGRMLVTNRPGTMVVIKDGKVVSEVSGIPTSLHQGQGGLMDVRVHPNYATNKWIYVAYNEPAKSGNGGLTKIVRGKIEFTGGEAKWTDNQVIYEAAQEHYSRAGVHFGGKIAFDGKGHVFFSVGERGTNMGAQSTSTPFGKVMRVNEDGTIPADNPIPGSPMWSYGHRNQQGLAFDAQGNLWDTEHGPRGGDEFNLIKKGVNYGWPVVAFSINYNDSAFRTPWPNAEQKIDLPQFRWLPSIGASGLVLVNGPAFKSWNGDLLAGGLVGENLDRIKVKDGKLVEREEILHGMGRIRDIRVAKDGTVYLVLNNPDIIVRLVPAS